MMPGYNNRYQAVIAQAVAQLFNVTVVAVSTANIKGKPKRRGTSRGHTPAWR